MAQLKGGHYIRINYVCQRFRDFSKNLVFNFESSKQCGNLCQPTSAGLLYGERALPDVTSDCCNWARISMSGIPYEFVLLNLGQDLRYCFNNLCLKFGFTLAKFEALQYLYVIFDFLCYPESRFTPLSLTTFKNNMLVYTCKTFRSVVDKIESSKD
jgi:hypothetical protein